MKYHIFTWLLITFIIICNHSNAEKLHNSWGDTIYIQSVLDIATNMRESNPDSSVLIFNKVVEKTNHLEDKKYWIKANLSLASIEKQKGHKFIADSIYRKILQKKDILNHPQYEEICIGHAHLLYLLGKYEEANELYEVIMPLLKKKEKYITLVQCHINKAKIEIKKNEFVVAMEYFIEARNLAEQHNFTNKLALIYGNMGHLYFRQEAYDESLNYFEKSLKLHTQLDNTENIAVCYQSIGTLYIIKEDYLNAEIQLNKAGEFFIQSQRINKYMSVINNLGVLYKRQKKYQKAKDRYYEALALTRKTDNKIYQAMTLQNLSQVNFELGMTELAIKQLNEAILLSKQNGETDFREAYLNMATMHEAKGEYKTAYQWLITYKEHADSVFNIDKFKETENLINKYEAEKKELLIDQILLENGKKQATILRDRIIIIIGSSLILVLIVFLVLFRKKTVTVNESYNKLIKQSEKLSIAYKTIRDESLKTMPVKNNTTVNNANKSSVPIELRECILNQLNLLINKEQFYKNSELTIAETAKQLNTNTKYLSQIINDSFDVTFPNFINQLRVEEAQRLLKIVSKNNLTLEEIGFQSGFKSKSVFNTAFKRITGLTPSVYKKQIQLMDL